MWLHGLSFELTFEANFVRADQRIQIRPSLFKSKTELQVAVKYYLKICMKIWILLTLHHLSHSYLLLCIEGNRNDVTGINPI